MRDLLFEPVSFKVLRFFAKWQRGARKFNK